MRVICGNLQGSSKYPTLLNLVLVSASTLIRRIWPQWKMIPLEDSLGRSDCMGRLIHRKTTAPQRSNPKKIRVHRAEKLSTKQPKFGKKHMRGVIWKGGSGGAHPYSIPFLDAHKNKTFEHLFKPERLKLTLLPCFCSEQVSGLVKKKVTLN